MSKSHDLVIDLITNEGDGDEVVPLGNSDAAFLSALRSRNIPWRASWSATSGSISRESKTRATFTAPATVPAQDPVAVTAELTGLSYTTRVRGASVTFNSLKLVSNILVFDDAYEVTMISEIHDMAGTCLGASSYRDTGSFVVSLNGTEARIIERVNRNTSAFLNYTGGRCWNYKILKNGTGDIHISGTPSIRVTPPSAQGGAAIIAITFRQVPSIFPLFQVTCKCDDAPGGPFTSTNEKGVAMMASMLPAQPIFIKFEAKEGEQILWERGQPGGPVYSKCTVKQLRED